MSGAPSDPDTAPDVLAAAAPLYYREAARKQRERRKMMTNVDVETHNRTHTPPPECTKNARRTHDPGIISHIEPLTLRR